MNPAIEGTRQAPLVLLLLLGLCVSWVRLDCGNESLKWSDGREKLTISIVHRLYFHPLAKYPGPLLGKLSDWYSVYHSWLGDLHLDMYRCHQKYGDYVRYAPNRLVVNEASAVESILGTSKHVRKAKRYDSLVHYAPNTFTLTDKNEHSRRRRILSRGFSENALKHFEPTIQAQISRLCDAIDRKCEEDSSGWSEPLDMSSWSNYIAFDIMSNVIFGRDYNLTEKEDYRPVVHAIQDSNVRIGVLLQTEDLRFLRMDKWLFPTAIRGRNLFVSFVKKLLASRFRESQSQTTHDMMALFGGSDSYKGDGLTLEEAAAEGSTLVIAGSDTTATAIAGFIFYMSRHRAFRERVTAEVRRSFQHPADIRLGKALSECYFLRACLDESMRMSPPAAGVLWRVVEAGGLDLNGALVPADCEVGIPIYSLHHNERYHPDPFRFDPERWLHKVQEPSGAAAQRNPALIPFSIGSRGCVGKSLAWHELMLTTAHLLWRFDLAALSVDQKYVRDSLWAVPGRAEEYNLQDHLTSARQGPWIRWRLSQPRSQQQP